MFKSIKAIVYSFIIGVLTGATFGLFFAPRSGAETREIILEKSSALREQAIDTVEQERKEVARALERAKRKVEEKLNQIKEDFSKG